MSILFPFAGLGGIIYVIVLVLNGIAVLSEDRFLARVGWGRASTADPGFGGQNDPSSVKSRAIDLISSIRTVARIPLIVVNTFIIVYEIALACLTCRSYSSPTTPDGRVHASQSSSISSV